MLALRLDCSTAALITPQTVLSIWKLVGLKVLDFSDRTRTGISILTSAADLPPGVPSPDGALPGGKMGHNRTLDGSGPSDADNGKPDLRTGSPPLHYPGSGVGEKKNQRLTGSE